jgi:hypothetical protein
MPLNPGAQAVVDALRERDDTPFASTTAIVLMSRYAGGPNRAVRVTIARDGSTVYYPEPSKPDLGFNFTKLDGLSLLPSANWTHAMRATPASQPQVRGSFAHLDVPGQWIIGMDAESDEELVGATVFRAAPEGTTEEAVIDTIRYQRAPVVWSALEPHAVVIKRVIKREGGKKSLLVLHLPSILPLPKHVTSSGHPGPSLPAVAGDPFKAFDGYAQRIPAGQIVGVKLFGTKGASAWFVTARRHTPGLAGNVGAAFVGRLLDVLPLSSALALMAQASGTPNAWPWSPP